MFPITQIIRSNIQRTSSPSRTWIFWRRLIQVCSLWTLWIERLIMVFSLLISNSRPELSRCALSVISRRVARRELQLRHFIGAGEQWWHDKCEFDSSSAPQRAFGFWKNVINVAFDFRSTTTTRSSVKYWIHYAKRARLFKRRRKVQAICSMTPVDNAMTLESETWWWHGENATIELAGFSSHFFHTIPPHTPPASKFNRQRRNVIWENHQK